MHGHAHFGVAGAFVAASCGPVAHDVSLVNQVSTAFFFDPPGSHPLPQIPTVVRRVIQRFFPVIKFSGRPHPSHVFPHFATLLQDTQLAGEVTPRLTCVLLQFHPRLFHQSFFVVLIDIPEMSIKSQSEPQRLPSKILGISCLVDRRLSLERDGTRFTIDLDHLSVLSRPRWTRCMSQQLRHSACGPTNMATEWNT